MLGEIIMINNKVLTKEQFMKLCANYKAKKTVDKQYNEMITEGYFQDKHVRLNKYVNKW